MDEKTDAIRSIRVARGEGRTLISLAREHGVSKKTVLNVVHGRVWKHVD